MKVTYLNYLGYAQQSISVTTLMTKFHYLKIMKNGEVFKRKLFSDSIHRGMNIKEINRQIQGGTIHYKALYGAKSTQLNHRVTPTLEKCRYDAAIMHVDINGV